MAVTRVGTSRIAAAQATSMSVTRPSGTVAGDLMLVDCGIESGTAFTPPGGAGFTELINETLTPFPSTGLLDDFNRSNGALGASWGTVDLIGTPLQVISNECGNVSGGSYWTTSFGADQEAYVEYRAGSGIWLFVRFANPTNESTSTAYILYWSSGTLELYRLDAGTRYVLLGSAPVTLSAGDLLGISAVGPLIRGFHKPSAGAWTQDVFVKDATYSSGGSIALVHDSSTTRTNNFSGGTQSPAAIRLGLYSRVDDGSSGPWTFTYGGSNVYQWWRAVSFRGHDPAAPIAAYASQKNTSSRSVVAPSISPAAANSLLVYFGDPEGPASATWTAPSGMTSVDDIANGVYYAEQALTAPGATGTRTGTVSAAWVNAGTVVALAPKPRQLALLGVG